jgi:ABC-type multidrug transport system permease subunit
MFPVSPATYLVGGVMSAAIAGANVTCSAAEILHLIPPANSTCAAFLSEFADAAGGLLLNPESTDECRYCPLRTTDQFLSRFEIYIKDSWRNFGLMWVYILFNVGCAMGLYWLCRMPKGKGVKRANKKEAVDSQPNM